MCATPMQPVSVTTRNTVSCSRILLGVSTLITATLSVASVALVSSSRLRDSDVVIVCAFTVAAASSPLSVASERRGVGDLSETSSTRRVSSGPPSKYLGRVLSPVVLTYTLVVFSATCIAGAALTGCLLRYLLAYATCPLVFVFIMTMDMVGRVEYDTGHMMWPLHRMNLYATLRAASSFLPEQADRLALVAVATAETTLMFAFGLSGRGFGYRFGPTSLDFAHYAAVKTSVFLFLPFLERQLERSL